MQHLLHTGADMSLRNTNLLDGDSDSAKDEIDIPEDNESPSNNAPLLVELDNSDCGYSQVGNV